MLQQTNNTEVQLGGRQSDIILYDVLINLWFNFTLDDGKLSMPRGKQL